MSGNGFADPAAGFADPAAGFADRCGIGFADLGELDP